jgi:hypothetical protein
MIFNAARGHLAGTITLARTGRGFDMPSTNLDGEPVEVTVRLSGRGLPPGSTQNTSILVNTNGGKLEIPVSFRVSVPTGRIILRALRAGTVAAIIMAGYRLAIQAFYPEYVADPMEFVTLEHVTAYANRWAIVPLSLTFFSMVGGAIYLAYRMFLLRITQEMPQNAPPPLPRDTGGGGIGGGPLMGGPVTPPIPPDVMASRNRKRRYL